MKKLTACFLSVIIVLSLLPISAFAATEGNIYYVSSSGSDENSGTSEDSPWKTLARLICTLTGVYRVVSSYF